MPKFGNVFSFFTILRYIIGGKVYEFAGLSVPYQRVNNHGTFWAEAKVFHDDVIGEGRHLTSLIDTGVPRQISCLEKLWVIGHLAVWCLHLLNFVIFADVVGGKSITSRWESIAIIFYCIDIVGVTKYLVGHRHAWINPAHDIVSSVICRLYTYPKVICAVVQVQESVWPYSSIFFFNF